MRRLFFLLILSGVVLVACNKEAQLSAEKKVTLELPPTAYLYYEGTMDKSNEIATVGRVLFYDKHLSLNNTISCASCHKQEFAFADNKRFSSGFENKQTSRNSPALQDFNSFVFFDDQFGGNTGFFWDGRESNLKNLIMRPVQNHIEMGIDDPATLPSKLAALPYYKELFQKAFDTNEITIDRISESVERFLSAMHATNTRFDKSMFQLGGNNPLTALEQHGQVVFNTKYPCGKCHQPPTGPYFSAGFFNIGLDYTITDRGRAAVNGQDAEGSFKTPNLKNVALSAPYMHDGRFTTLDEVLDHYSEGIKENPALTPLLRSSEGTGAPLRLNITKEDKRAIIAFLGTLTDYSFITDPKFSDPFKVN